MAKNLLIVESPAKAKTIEKILGKDFKVKSSFGHIRDLPGQELGVDVENMFEPVYIVTPDKTKVVAELKKEVKASETVWLATDEDREGEAISWHLSEVLNLDKNTTKRITFREITKTAVKKAIENPRTIDMNLVNAQQARRILDRLVGFELSQLLWKKIKGKLSAGRVQSVAVKLVVEREREIRNFMPEASFKVYAIFSVTDDNNKVFEIKAELNNTFPDEDQADNFLQTIKSSTYKITDISVKPLKRSPAPPFTTSTLQQEASIRFRFSVKKTMTVAQKLYENGAITYMRTDSTSLSNEALGAISEFVKNEFGDKYYQFRTYKSKSANAQEAHEAIRPTYVENKFVSENKDEQRLYELIWKRAIASQMASAELERTDVTISISDWARDNFIASGEVIKFDGYLRLYNESTEDEDEDGKTMLPPVKTGQVLKCLQIEAIQKYTKPNSRYSEASLVKKLEALGIGRPSTYAPTISRIMEENKGYIVKDKIEGVEREYIKLVLKAGKLKKEVHKELVGTSVNRLHPTDMGMVVTDFLESKFSRIMDYGFTAEVEAELDDVAEKGLDWKKLLAELYFPFHKEIEETSGEQGKVKATRVLGKDPVTGHTVLVQILRYGPVVQIGTKEEVGEEGKPKFANLTNGYSMETITFEDAMSLFQLPKHLGNYNNEEVSVGNGRYGNYIKFMDKFISLPKGVNPLELNINDAIEYIHKKNEEDKPVGIYKSFPITKGKGRFGPFLKWNELYINVPVKIDLDNIGLEDAIGLIEKKIEKEANRFIQNWEKEGISIENGRWGAYIRFKKMNFKIPKTEGKNPTEEYLKSISLEQVREIIDAQAPGIFKGKKK
ncbi:MAG: type I DNA topoisomerase [Saprospiraceae bacterium]|nr:type I DNA topoisomerase [Saprospiraceae bacterium]